MDKTLVMFKDKYIAHRNGIKTVNLNLRKINEHIKTRAARGISSADLKAIRNHLILVKNKSNEDEETMRFRWKEIKKSCSLNDDGPMIEAIEKLIGSYVQKPRKRGESSSQQSIEEGGSHKQESPETDKQIRGNKSLNETQPPPRKPGRPRKLNTSYDNSACSTGSEPSKCDETSLQSFGDTQSDDLQVPQQGVDKSAEEIDTRKSLELHQSAPKKRGRPRKDISCNSGCVGCDIKKPLIGLKVTGELQRNYPSTHQAGSSNRVAKVVGVEDDINKQTTAYHGSPTMSLAELSDPATDDDEKDMITPISPPQPVVKYITSMHNTYYDKSHSAEDLGAADACSWYGRKPNVLPEIVREKNKHFLRQCKTAVIVLDDFFKTCVPWSEEQDASELSTDSSKTSSATGKHDKIKKELNIKQNKGLIGLKIQPLNTEIDAAFIKQNRVVGRIISKRGDKSTPENIKNSRKGRRHPPSNLDLKKSAGGLPKSTRLLRENKSKFRGLNRSAVAMTAKTHSEERNASNDPTKNLSVPICKLRRSKAIEAILKIKRVVGANRSLRRKVDVKTYLPKKVAPDFKDILRKGNLLVGMKISQPSTGMKISQPSTGRKMSQPSTRKKMSQPSMGMKISQPSTGMKMSQPSTSKSTTLVGTKIKSSEEETRTQTGAKYDRRSSLPDVIPAKITSNNLLKDMLPYSLFKDSSNTSFTDFDLNGVIDKEELRPFTKKQKIANESENTESIRVCEFAKLRPGSLKEIVSECIESLPTNESPENESTDQPIKLLFRNLGNAREDGQNYKIVSNSMAELNTEDTIHDKSDKDESGREKQTEDVPLEHSVDLQYDIAVTDRPPLKDYTRQRTARTAQTKQEPKTAQIENHLTSNDNSTENVINEDLARPPFPTPSINNTNVLAHHSEIPFPSSETNLPGNMINQSLAKIHKQLPPLLPLGSIPKVLPSASTTDSEFIDYASFQVDISKAS